ncbi:PEP-CTERM protein-sorting domain-containing protein/MYXO-CTERM domain-containing protein [Bryocella elongata]|uniref:PEP-CTERM protein-sorting domain-containing protein/MYXO-CTERM domain-containing protein n=1 Tax=Bryocella elongata TaxID=863522 RepID=A0A1H5TAA7_9BACT|nr:PEP-CTERM sorting domain-containing protein [Bryocella elongata]SEF59753.1 PEP-CTERM protein-sorting domain-containing protein/MYXO-CTERM domain-containing protein [Bryocella elongata]
MKSFRLAGVGAACFCLMFGSAAARASEVTSISNGTVYTIPSVNQQGAGPETVATGITWTSTNSGAVFGYSDTYGFNDNGIWNGLSMAGVNSSSDSMTFTFSDSVSAAGAFINYSPSWGNPTIAVYDTNGNLIESEILDFAVADGPDAINEGYFYGFQESTADIGSFTITGAYAGVSEITLSGSVAATPEPGALVLLGTGLLGMGGVFSRRRSRSIA